MVHTVQKIDTLASKEAFVVLARPRGVEDGDGSPPFVLL
jgi:hypothetical protein